MAKISVSEAANVLGVNVQRVHQRIADGSLPGERVGHQWVIDEADLARLDRRGAGRPLSPRSAWILAMVASLDAAEPDGPVVKSPVDSIDEAAGKRLSSISPSERSRAHARLRELLKDALISPGRPDEPVAGDLAASLRSLLRSRAERRLFRASPRDLDDLRADRRIIPSGVSLSSSGIASRDIVEGYIPGHHLDALVNDFILSDARHGDGNVVLHVVNPADIPGWSVKPDGWLVLAADLAEHHRPREIVRAEQILRDVARENPAMTKPNSK